MEMIRDGKGRGYLAAVNQDNRLLIAGVTSSKEHYTNLNFNDSYNMLFSLTPSAGGNFLYLKNESDKKIICEGFSIYSAAAEKISIYLSGVGTPQNGSDVIPANLTSGSGKNAIGTFQTGQNITGITGQVLAYTYRISDNNENKFRNFDADIVIPKSQTLVMEVTNGGSLIEGFLVFWHENIN